MDIVPIYMSFVSKLVGHFGHWPADMDLGTLITCTVTSAVHARFQCMKSALVKPQNARMSDSECGQVGLNTRADFMYSKLQCNDVLQ